MYNKDGDNILQHLSATHLLMLKRINFAIFVTIHKQYVSLVAIGGDLVQI